MSENAAYRKRPGYDTCDECKGFNPAWFTDDATWRKHVPEDKGMGAHGLGTVLCPRCFAARVGFDTGREVRENGGDGADQVYQAVVVALDTFAATCTNAEQTPPLRLHLAETSQGYDGSYRWHCRCGASGTGLSGREQARRDGDAHLAVANALMTTPADDPPEVTDDEPCLCDAIVHCPVHDPYEEPTDCSTCGNDCRCDAIYDSWKDRQL